MIEMLRAMMNIIPIKEIKNWFNTDAKDNKEFVEFVHKVKTTKFRKLITDFTENKYFKDVRGQLRENGFNLIRIWKMISEYFDLRVLLEV